MTVVIMLLIVLMWAVVLIPMWLRRHDDVEESRSLDRFSTAMHTLSRREEAPEKKYLVMPNRSREHDVHLSGGAAADRPRKSATEVRAEKMARARRSGPQPVAARRRRTLTGLALVALVTLAAWFLVGGTILLALQLISDLALVGFLWSLRGSSGAARVVSEPRRRPAPAPAARRAPSAAPRTRAVQPVRRGGSLYDDYGRDMYDDDEWRDLPAPSRVAAASAAPRRQASEPFDQSALDDRVDTGVHDAWLDEPTYAEAPRVIEEPQYFELPRSEPVRERAPARERAPERVAPPARPQATPRRRTAPVEPAAERTRGRRTIDSRRTSVSDRIASYSRDLEVDVVRPSRAPRPAAASEGSIGARPWEPVPVPRPVYTTKPAAPRRTARAPMPEPLPPVAEPTERSAAEASPEELEAILDRRWAVND